MRNKIIFMGTPDFSAPILKAVHETYGVALVITQPDKPVGRKRILTPPPVKKQALELGIEVYQPESMRSDEAVEFIQNVQPDLIITAAYGQILPKRVLDIPRLGCINVHASLLPKYRGGAPIHKAIINGESESGVTIMYMAEQLDAGNMIAQEKVEILENDTVGLLHDKLSDCGVELLIDTLPSIFNGTNDSIEQNHDEATFASNISRDEEFVDFNRSTKDVHNQIRGLSPWPVAYATLDGKNMKFWLSEKGTATGVPGEIIEVTKDAIVVATNDASIKLLEIQPAGKKRMKVRDYVAGLQYDLKGMKFNAE